MTDAVTVDARGLACPQPVLETKRVFDEGQVSRFIVLVDNPTSKENVSRFARNQGCEVGVEETSPGQYKITIDRDISSHSLPEPEPLLPCPLPQTADEGRYVVFIGTETMGAGDDELGAKLMRGFLRTLIDCPPKPWRMIFINSGVKLTTLDDDAVESISLMQDKGVEILACGTCLQHFGLENKLRVGRATNMFEVIESLNAATKVISPD
ncbi:MAG: sulfurtransferase-like selenium metabolism protein YedF [Thermodesulfobacteriota bacterium]